VTFGITRETGNALLHIMRCYGNGVQMDLLPKDSRTLVGHNGKIDVKQVSSGHYTYIGIKTHILSSAKLFDPSSTVLQLTVNVDGVPLFKSSSLQYFGLLLGRLTIVKYS
jgi:hypothetical protein